MGPIGVEQRVWRRWSIDIPEGFAVVSEVLMVLICLSVKPLDLGSRGKDVIWWISRDSKVGEGFRKKWRSIIGKVVVRSAKC